MTVDLTRCEIPGCDELPEDHWHPGPGIEDEDRLTAAIHWHYCAGEMPPPGSTTALGMCGYSNAHRRLAQTLIALLPPAIRLPADLDALTASGNRYSLKEEADRKADSDTLDALAAQREQRRQTRTPK